MHDTKLEGHPEIFTFGFMHLFDLTQLEGLISDWGFG